MRGGVFRGAAVGGVSPRRATIAQYTSSPITRPAEGGVSPRWGGGGGVRGGVFRGAAVGGESSRRATIAQYTSSPITRPAEGGVSPR